MEREEAIRQLEDHINGHCPADFKRICKSELMCRILELLKEQPQIVRCKDCKYAKKWNVNTIRCRINSNDLNAFHCADWFCADGKRKDGD